MTETDTPNSRLAPLATASLIIAGVSLFGMAVVEGWQVFARYVLNDSPSWTEPVALLLMSTTMMLGAAVGVQRESHFGFFIAVESAPASLSKWLRLTSRVIVAGIGAFLSGWGAVLMIDAWDYSMAGVPLPQGVVYLPVCVGGALIVIFAIERMLLVTTEAK
jgi:TRAP-type C4-dicarboxylate transport system permease small subunit